MNFTVLTLFPNVIYEYINTSIIARAIEKKLVKINIIDLKDFGEGLRRNVDDTVYGGGEGMIITLPVLDRALTYIKEENKKDNLRTIYLSPKGKVLNQELSEIIVQETQTHIILLAGHYEGIDERIFKMHNIEELSIGDYILTGGELPALVLIDNITRLIPGVLKPSSTKNESHNEYLLEEPQYTKPSIYKGLEVPQILTSGNHEKIAKYRFEEKIYTTYKKRKDLLNKYIELKNIDKEQVNKIIKEKEEKQNGFN